jgi:hypothetical protein
LIWCIAKLTSSATGAKEFKIRSKNLADGTFKEVEVKTEEPTDMILLPCVSVRPDG